MVTNMLLKEINVCSDILELHLSTKELKPTLSFLKQNCFLNVSLAGNSEKFLFYRIYNFEILSSHQQMEGIF